MILQKLKMLIGLWKLSLSAWILKNIVFEKLEKYRTPGTLITSNTSGIPIKFMSEGRSEDFQKHFCGTHFFNPARYLNYLKLFLDLKLMRCIRILNGYGEQFLGKTSVLLKIHQLL
jgi:3-hydroxyacyl-CoA dehydrogenase